MQAPTFMVCVRAAQDLLEFAPSGFFMAWGPVPVAGVQFELTYFSHRERLSWWRRRMRCVEYSSWHCWLASIAANLFTSSAAVAGSSWIPVTCRFLACAAAAYVILPALHVVFTCWIRKRNMFRKGTWFGKETFGSSPFKYKTKSQFRLEKQ